MYRLSKGTTKPLKYEDIVVKAFQMFPDDFALRGYKEYPDSSDIHKPLYGPLKRQGLIRSANKTFALTQRGVEVGSNLIAHAGAALEEALGTGDRLTRDHKVEIERMTSSDAFKFFINGQPQKILDTDFYAFIGATVRTPKNDFTGRLMSTEAAINAATKLKLENSDDLTGVWDFMKSTFRALIERRQGGASGY